MRTRPTVPSRPVLSAVAAVVALVATDVAARADQAWSAHRRVEAAAAGIDGRGAGAASGPRTDSAWLLSAPALQSALDAAVAIPDARVEIVSLDRPASDCATTSARAHAEVSRPVDGSGRFAVKLVGARPSGAPCEVWVWARVRLFAKVPVTRRALRTGEALAPAVATEEREIKPGHLPAVIADGAVAERALGPGLMIEADVVRAPGLRAGASVTVVIQAGTLVVEETGHVVACPRNHNCAVLPSGKYVDGTLVDGRLMVQVP